MSRLVIHSSDSALGSEGDFADALHSVASQIEEAYEWSDEFRGQVSAGTVQIEWFIEEME